jgi:organic hydroperoxide reductase OsmC/OhrA
MARQHSYSITTTWKGNTGSGTSGYRNYERSFEMAVPGKPLVLGSSDPAFRGDRARWNPEELLVASLSSCHQLWYLHLCADAGVVVLAYVDDAVGLMEESSDGGGQFVSVTLKPKVLIATGCDVKKAQSLHEAAHEKCFIARSVHFPVTCEATITAANAAVL